MDSRKLTKAARRRASRRRFRIRFASFSAGVLTMLLIGVFVLLNGRGGDPITPLAQPVTASLTTAATQEASEPVQASPMATAEETTEPTAAPSPSPAPTPEKTSASAETAQAEPKSAATAAPVSVKLNVDDKIEMTVGDTGQLRATIDPPDPSASLVWKSSDEKVVKVNQKGAVKAVGAGTAQVGLWVNGGSEARATVKIKVAKESSTYVWISKTGKKYHSDPNCSNMKNPKKVNLAEAKAMGYTACKKCY